MKQTKKIDEKINPKSVTVFGLPLRITPEIRDVTFRLSETNPEKYAAIKKSIAAANGKLDEPIKVMKLGSETGDYYTIVDGHTRFEVLMDLNILPPDSNFVDISKTVMCEADAKKLASRLNYLRRQAYIYEQAVNAINSNSTLSDREIADNCKISHTTISQVRYILSVKNLTADKTDAETQQLSNISKELETGVKGIEPIYAQLKKAESISTKIYLIKDKELQEKLREHFEVIKYTKSNVEVLFEKYLYPSEATEYDKKAYPIMNNIVNLRKNYEFQVQVITTAANKEAIDNALGSIRRYLMDKMGSDIWIVKESITKILDDELDAARNRNLGDISTKIENALKTIESERYFIGILDLPKKP